MSTKAYARTWRWEPLMPSAKVVVCLLAASGAIALVQVIRIASSMSDIAGVTVPFDQFGRNLQSQIGVGPLGSVDQLVTLAAGVVWLIWQHKAQADLYARGVPGLRYTPGWVVGWWFIPVANFVMPYLTMRELWDKGGGSEGSRSSSPPGAALLAWWLAYVAAGVVGVIGLVPLFRSMFHSIIEQADVNGSARITSITLSAASLHAARLGVIAADALRAVAAGLAIWVVLTISRREDAIGLAVPTPAQGFVGMLPPAPPRPDL